MSDGGLFPTCMPIDPLVASRKTIRSDIVSVFPVPAPAVTTTSDTAEA